MPRQKLIVGLGNPGKKYERTRHNFGFIVTQSLAGDYRLKWKRSRFYKGFVAKGEMAGYETFLLLPLTYMNNSGTAVKALVRRKNIDLKDILIVCDDLDLDFGRIRLRASGSGAGNKGLLSIIEQLGSKDFARLRLGIGRPPESVEASGYVLSPFLIKERKQLDSILENAKECCVTWLKDGASRAMSQFNTKI